MDLGIHGKTAIISAASNGLGKACAMALAREGVNIVINGRTEATLESVAQEIEKIAPDVAISQVVGSITEVATRSALVEAADGKPDILINNAGGPPPGDFRDWDRDTWISAFDTNMHSAIEMVRLTIDGMAQRKFGRIVSITSSAVRVPIPVIGLSNATRAGLTNFLFGLAPSVASKGVTINNLLPGPFDTNRLRNSTKITEHLTTNPTAGRLGNPDELGAMCAFLCSQHTGYMTAQNVLMDGGLYSGSFNS